MKCKAKKKRIRARFSKESEKYQKNPIFLKKVKKSVEKCLTIIKESGNIVKLSTRTAQNNRKSSKKEKLFKKFLKKVKKV